MNAVPGALLYNHDNHGYDKATVYLVTHVSERYLDDDDVDGDQWYCTLGPLFTDVDGSVNVNFIWKFYDDSSVIIEPIEREGT